MSDYLETVKGTARSYHMVNGNLFEPPGKWSVFLSRKQGPTIVCRAEPGNGTRYEIIVAKLSLAQSAILGGGPQYLVSVNMQSKTGKGRLLVWNLSQLDPGYVMEKLGLNLGDAVPVCVICHRLGERYRKF